MPYNNLADFVSNQQRENRQRDKEQVNSQLFQKQQNEYNRSTPTAYDQYEMQRQTKNDASNEQDRQMAINERLANLTAAGHIVPLEDEGGQGSSTSAAPAAAPFSFATAGTATDTPAAAPPSPFGALFGSGGTASTPTTPQPSTEAPTAQKADITTADGRKFRFTTPEEQATSQAKLAKTQADAAREQSKQTWATNLKAMETDPSMADFVKNHSDTINALTFKVATGQAIPEDTETKALGDILNQAKAKLEAGDTKGSQAMMDFYTQSKAAAHPSDGGMVALTGPALDQAAHRFALTGVMPPAGMGKAGQATRVAIMNRSAELHPDANIGANAAFYSANKASMVKSLAQYDAMAQYERTAGDNLNLFLGQAKKVVDSGSPWINTPLRDVNSKLLGNDDLPAYNAARQVAVNEIARVTSNPGLAGQLSDTARREVSNFNPENATLAQTVKVAQVLRSDMTNRKTEAAQQLQNQSKRFGVQGPEGIRSILGEDTNPTPGTTGEDGNPTPSPSTPVINASGPPPANIPPPPPVPMPMVKNQKLDIPTRDKILKLFGGNKAAAIDAATKAGWDISK